MSDDTTPRSTEPDAREPHEPDERDEQVAALLAVEPLDDVTRRRLVRDALAESGAAGPKRSRFVAAVSVAAAILIGVIAGVALVNRPEAPTTTAAAPAKAADGASVGEAVNPSGSVPEAQRSAGVFFTPLGDAGDVTKADQLRTRLNALFTQGGQAPDAATATQYVCADSQPEAFGLVEITAAATGTFQGQPVTVLVGTAPPDGSVRAVVVSPTACAVLSSVTLTPA
jgi:hypothetical protein